MTALTPVETRARGTDLPVSSAPLFGSVLGRGRAPKRQLGTGAAFAVAVNLWLLVAVLSTRAHQAPESRAPIDVVFTAALPPAPPPPPPPGGAAHPKTPKIERAKVDPSTFKESKDLPKPAPEEEKAADEPEPGGQKDGVAGGTIGGEVGGKIGGTIGGEVGGTGTVAPTASSPPATFKQINIGEGTDQSAPVWVGSPAPAYPAEALAAKQEGVVLVRCNAYPDGSLQGCKILKSNPFFDAAVLAHLGQTRVKPFTSNGKPVSGFVPINIPVRFKLPSP